MYILLHRNYIIILNSNVEIMTKSRLVEHAVHVDSEVLAVLLHVRLHGLHVGLPGLPVVLCHQVREGLHLSSIATVKVLKLIKLHVLCRNYRCFTVITVNKLFHL